jgi:5-methylcytosine-specific restriction endonuclease McrA
VPVAVLHIRAARGTARRDLFRWTSPRNDDLAHRERLKNRVLQIAMIEDTEREGIAVGGEQAGDRPSWQAVLAALPDENVLTGLDGEVATEKRCMANVIAYLGEVEERRLHLEAAYSSMFAFCQRRLRLSEGEAFRRLRAARLTRRFPILLPALAERRVTLSNVILMHDHFTEENVGALVGRMEGKTKLEVKELIAELAPKPDVLPSVTPVGVCESKLLPEDAPAASAAPVTPRSPEPLSPDRYHVSFTASTAFRDKLERARDLLRHRVPDGNLEAVFDRALDALIAQLEKEIAAKTVRPRRVSKAPKDPGAVSRAARREVMARDGKQCAFVSADGVRCTERGGLEIDHLVEKARGGTGAPNNLQVLCRAHNKLKAEQAFGRAHVEERIRERRQESSATDLRQEKSAEPEAPDTRQLVEKALVGLGFRRAEAQRALVTLDGGSWQRPVPDLIREAIGVLT